MYEYTNMKDDTGLANVFCQDLVRVSDYFSLSVGIARNYFLLSKDLSVESRVSLKWEPNEKNSFSMGYGLHSMIEKLDAYFYRDTDGNLANKDLGLTKAHHLHTTYVHKLNKQPDIAHERLL